MDLLLVSDWPFYDILDVIQLSDRMLQLMIDGWNDSIPTLEKEYVSWQLALASVSSFLIGFGTCTLVAL